MSDLSLFLPVSDIGGWFQTTASDGSMLLAIPVALIAGLVSFFSPCVLPLLPGYLSYVTGLSGADLQEKGSSGVRGRMLAGSVLFVLGFSLVFVAVGGAFGQLIFSFLNENQSELMRVLGIVVVLLGLVFLGLGGRWAQRDMRFHVVPNVGVGAAPLLGVLFGLGWTPCIGPTLGAVLMLSATSPTRSAFLTFVYCLGLGVPFILAAVGFRRFMGATAWLRRHQQWVTRIGGGLLIVVGLLLLTGVWAELIQWTQTKVVGFETPV